ncbi:hypothetical protein EBU71_13280, partial [bacterium]|nr:hypothetical protein [Candidatus Elulimicrobium humile]
PLTTYEIKLRLSVELSQFVFVEFGIGNNQPITLTFSSNAASIPNSGVNYWPKSYEVNFVYNTPNTLTSPDRQLWIRKLDGGILRLLNTTIIQRRFEYHPTYNNLLFSAITNTNDIEFPNDATFTTLGTTDNGNIVSTNFGNGVFRSGLWENGVWNDGYRSNNWFGSLDYTRFSNIIGINGITPYNGNNSYSIDDFTWRVCLQGVGFVGNFEVGEKVSIGNIVAIDVNEKRRLITDYYKVITINTDDNTLTVELKTNFKVRRVERDSSNHLIYVTNNIWLSGAFLNGFFSGVWNNGIIKGFPNISVMSNTHIIEGKIDGGRVISSKVYEPLINGEYQTGLVQKATILDNNISGLVNDGNSDSWKKYLTWMDLNYEPNSSLTNLRQDSRTLILENLIGVTYATFINNDNLKGEVTYDVLESQSFFRDSYSLQGKFYSLGTKYSKYENLVPNEGNFLEPFSNDRVFNSNDPNAVSLRFLIDSGLGGFDGLNNFFGDGWTYSETSTQNISGYSQSTGSEISSNVNINTANKLRITILHVIT